MDRIRKYLPSQAFIAKIGVLVLVVLVCWGIHAVYAKLVAWHESKNSPEATPLVLNDLAALETKNGVPDWQTNIEEVLGQNTAAAPAGAAANTQPPNETEQLAQALFSSAATVNEAGPLSDTGAQTIADSATDQLATTQLGETFTQSDITVIPDTQASENAYIASATNLLDVKYPLDIDTSVAILQAAISANDATGLSQLAPISQRYSDLIAAFKKLPVPQSFADNDLAFLNLLGQIQGSIQAMSNTFSDPAATMTVFLNYPAMINNLIGFISPFTDKLPYSTLSKQAAAAGTLQTDDDPNTLLQEMTGNSADTTDDTGSDLSGTTTDSTALSPDTTGDTSNTGY